MALVLFELKTDYVGCSTTEVYEISDEQVYKEDESINEEFISEVGYDLARDNAEMYGIYDDGEFDEEPFSFTYKILTGMTREEIEEEWGTICNL